MERINKTTIPNQKTIIIERSSESVKKDFLKVSNENLGLAMLNLSPNAFKLWIYFTDNANGYKLELYSIDFEKRANVSKSTYGRCFKELEEKGYLIKSQKEKNFYLFKEKSDSKDLKHIDQVWSLENKALEDIIEEYFTQNDFKNEEYLSQNE